MADSPAERRQTARVTVRGVHSERTVTLSVRLVDISLGGVMMLSSRPIELGQRAHMSTRLGKRALDADIEIRRVSVVHDCRGDYRIAARFVALDEAARGAMRQFLAQGQA